MATYDSGYTILEDVRLGIDEYSASLVAGTDTTGAFDNQFLTSKINSAQRFIYNLLLPRIPEYFLKSSSLTAVAGVLTLPWDFGSIVELKDDDGAKVYPIQPAQFKLSGSDGVDWLYYRKGNTLVLDKSGSTNTFTLWYRAKCREIHGGVSSAGGALSITLSSTYAKKIADYYNGMTIENLTDDWVDTISDYTAARVATLAAQTGATSKLYGVVSELPEPFHSLIAPRAVIEAKLHPLTKEKPDVRELKSWNEMLVETLRAYAGTSEDVTIDDAFCDFAFFPGRGVGIVND